MLSWKSHYRVIVLLLFIIYLKYIHMVLTKTCVNLFAALIYVCGSYVNCVANTYYFEFLNYLRKPILLKRYEKIFPKGKKYVQNFYQIHILRNSLSQNSQIQLCNYQWHTVFLSNINFKLYGKETASISKLSKISFIVLFRAN